MTCHICDVCNFEGIAAKEYQELHITVKANEGNIAGFSDICKKFGGKSITISLGLQTPEFQTMSSISFAGSRDMAFDIAEKFAKEVTDIGCIVERVKLECSIFHSDFEGENGYFEGHLVVDTLDNMVYMLDHAARLYNAHCSKNAIKENVRMITYRHKGSKKDFIDKMNDLYDFVSLVWDVSKKIQEYCYYDSNVDLDKKWINRFV